MPPACLWVTCTEVGDLHSTQGFSKSEWTCKWTGADTSLQGTNADLQHAYFTWSSSQQRMPRGSLKCKKGSTSKKQSVRCRGAEWLLCIINQLMRLTLEHLVSEKDEALLKRENYLRAVEETNWLSCWQWSVISLKWAAYSQCNAP